MNSRCLREGEKQRKGKKEGKSFDRPRLGVSPSHTPPLYP